MSISDHKIMATKTTYEEWFNNKVKENSVKIKMPLNKKQRNLCHQQRDNYLKCSKLLVQDFQNHKNFGKVLKSCESEVGSMFGKCPSSWVDHFIRGDMNENFLGKKK